MKKDYFFYNPSKHNLNEAFVVHFLNIKTEDELFAQLSSKLNFPLHFGFNWNAVYDCLRDFNWIKQKRIILVFDEIPKVENEVLFTLLDTLRDSVEDWLLDKSHDLEIVFPENSENLIISYFD